MQRLIRVSLAGMFCVGVAAGVVIWLAGLFPPMWTGAGELRRRGLGADGARAPIRARIRLAWIGEKPGHSISSSRSSRTEATKPSFGSWHRSKTWDRLESCERPLVAAGRGLWLRSKRNMRRSSSNRSPVPSRCRRSCGSSNQSDLCICMRGVFAMPAHGSKRLSRRADLLWCRRRLGAG